MDHTTHARLISAIIFRWGFIKFTVSMGFQKIFGQVDKILDSKQKIKNSGKGSKDLSTFYDNTDGSQEFKTNSWGSTPHITFYDIL